jgi:hypothetical protein
MGERVAFPMEGNQNTLNPLNNKANENKYGGLINLDREENLFDQLKTPIRETKVINKAQVSDSIMLASLVITKPRVL